MLNSAGKNAYTHMGPSNMLPCEYHGAMMMLTSVDVPSSKLTVRLPASTPGNEMASVLKDWKSCGSGMSMVCPDALIASLAEASWNGGRIN